MKFSKQRIEAFTDGVIAIIITIMVLGIPLPESFARAEIGRFLTSVFIYFLSFIVVGAFWNQHHRAFALIKTATRRIVAANFMFLFFLSLIPLLTKWVIENPGMLLPVVGYDVVFLLVSLCYIFIFRLAMEESMREELERIREIRKARKETAMKHPFVRFAALAAAIAGVVVFSVSFPRVSSLVLLGVPVLSSLMNIFCESGPDGQKRGFFRKGKKTEEPRES